MMKTLGATQAVYAPLNKIGPNHEKHDGKCPLLECPVEASHNHRTEQGCLSCVKDWLEGIFPLQESIKNLKVSKNIEINNFAKEVLANISLFTPALSTSEISGAVLNSISETPVNSYIVPPLGVAAMHFANRGKSQIPKLFLTSLTCIGVTALQQFINFPRALVRALVAVPLFYIEKMGNHHIHDEKCNHKDHENDLEHDHGQESNKADLIGLVKLQALINTIPLAINAGVRKLKDLNNESSNFITKFFGGIGIFAFKVLGLSTGFVACGRFINFGLNKLGYKDLTNGNTSGKVGAVACACCGAPVCVVEATAEAASESSALMLGGEHGNSLSDVAATFTGTTLTGILLGTLLKRN